MKKTVNLISGNITSTLFKLAIPILGTSFVQMAYNLIDMIWVGKISSNAVAAVGTAGFFTWFGSSLVYLSKIGTEIGLAQAIGKNDNKERKKYIYSGLLINIIIAITYMILILIFNERLIGFFNLGDKSIISMAKDYLIFVALGFVFSFLKLATRLLHFQEVPRFQSLQFEILKYQILLLVPIHCHQTLKVFCQSLLNPYKYHGFFL